MDHDHYYLFNPPDPSQSVRFSVWRSHGKMCDISKSTEMCDISTRHMVERVNILFEGRMIQITLLPSGSQWTVATARDIWKALVAAGWKRLS